MSKSWYKHTQPQYQCQNVFVPGCAELVQGPASSPRARYELPGTDIGYRATRASKAVLQGQEEEREELDAVEQ
eukprot:3630069-Rhodomonas_salina.1